MSPKEDQDWPPQKLRQLNQRWLRKWVGLSQEPSLERVLGLPSLPRFTLNNYKQREYVGLGQVSPLNNLVGITGSNQI